ncbi:MAG: sulfoxide reductase heme-binding subunit YedZ [Gammaproteobacteria bacterium]|nr:sulfoxide reductase heme-binding subunit YedZ [Gammaproteobacteria bacterium]
MSATASPAAARHRWGTTKKIRYVGKPLVFVLSLLPIGLIALRAFEITGTLGANPVEALMDHFGIWGLRFLIITLAVSPLRQVLGKPWPLQFRRMLGLFAYFYIMLHLATYLWLDQYFDAAAIIEDIIERPYITLGMSAVLMLTALAVTSPHAARRRLGKTWQQIHYLVYPAAILGVWHFWWQVKNDILEPLIYAVLLSGLLLWRLIKTRAHRSRINPT